MDSRTKRPLTSAELDALTRRALGTGDVYGYPHAGLTGGTWRTAFLAMTDAILADARRYATPLPRPLTAQLKTGALVTYGAATAPASAAIAAAPVW